MLGIMPIALNEFIDSKDNAILDGVPYIESSNKMCKSVRNQNKHNIMSALVLR